MSTNKLQRLLPFSNEAICTQKRAEFNYLITDRVRSCLQSHSLVRKLATELNSGVMPYVTVPINNTTERSCMFLTKHYRPPVSIAVIREDVCIPSFTLSSNMDWDISDVNAVEEVDRAIRVATNGMISQEEVALFSLLTSAGTSREYKSNQLNLQVHTTFSESVLVSMVKRLKDKGFPLTHVLLSPNDLEEYLQSYNQTGANRNSKAIVEVEVEYQGIKYPITLIATNYLGYKGNYTVKQVRGNLQGSILPGTLLDGKSTYNDYNLKNATVADEKGEVLVRGETQVYGISKPEKGHDKYAKGLVYHLASPFTWYEDTSLIKVQKQGYWGYQDIGMALLEQAAVVMEVIDRN